MINVDVLLPLSMNEDIASFSIKVPLQNIEKLLSDVAGNPVGAGSQPLAKVIVVDDINVPNFCTLVLK